MARTTQVKAGESLPMHPEPLGKALGVWNLLVSVGCIGGSLLVIGRQRGSHLF